MSHDMTIIRNNTCLTNITIIQPHRGSWLLLGPCKILRHNRIVLKLSWKPYIELTLRKIYSISAVKIVHCIGGLGGVRSAILTCHPLFFVRIHHKMDRLYGVEPQIETSQNINYSSIKSDIRAIKIPSPQEPCKPLFF